MIELDGLAAYLNVQNQTGRGNECPTVSDSRFHDGGLYPSLNPKFSLARGETVFTIGCEFARRVEEVLVEHGFDVPVSRFDVQARECHHHPAQLLNTYNVGTTVQRLRHTLGSYTYHPDAGIEETQDGSIDLLLDTDNKPVSRERLVAEKGDIAQLYSRLLLSDTVLVSIALTDGWYDQKFDCYLNQAPSDRAVKGEPRRFSFRRFDLPDIVRYLDAAIAGLCNAGVKKILVAIAPVCPQPVVNGDVVVNTGYSQMSLRVALEELCRKYESVDYYPSYEIATSYGIGGYDDDGVHLKTEIARRIASHMVDGYIAPQKGTPVI